MFSTSRYCSAKTRAFSRNVAHKSDSVYVARGKKTITELVDFCRKKGEDKLFIVFERKSGPAYIRVILIDELGNWEWDEKRTAIENESQG